MRLRFRCSFGCLFGLVHRDRDRGLSCHRRRLGPVHRLARATFRNNRDLVLLAILILLLDPIHSYNPDAAVWYSRLGGGNRCDQLPFRLCFPRFLFQLFFLVGVDQRRDPVFDLVRLFARSSDERLCPGQIGWQSRSEGYPQDRCGGGVEGQRRRRREWDFRWDHLLDILCRYQRMNIHRFQNGLELVLLLQDRGGYDRHPILLGILFMCDPFFRPVRAAPFDFPLSHS